MTNWKVVEGCANYSVSEDGRVRNDKRGRELNLTVRKDGYVRVMLYDKGFQVGHYVHVLVAKAFIPNPDNLPEVNHIDEIKSHNWKANLEWSSKKDNIQHSLHKWCKTYVFLSPTGEKVIVNNVKDFCKENGLHQGNMSGVATGKRQSHRGWRKYVV